MHGASHIAPRSGVFQFSRRIPKNIVEALKALPPDARTRLPDEFKTYFAKEFVRFSLKTRDKAAAKSLGTKADFEFDTKVQRLKEWLARGENSYDVVDPDLIRAIAQRWVSQELKEDDEKRLHPDNAHDLRHHEKGLYMLELDFQKALSVDGAVLRDPVASATVQDIQTLYQLRLDPNGTGYALLHREVLLGYLSLYDVIKRRNAGQVAPTPVAPQIDLNGVNQVRKIAPDNLVEMTRAVKGGDQWGANPERNVEMIPIGKVIDDYFADVVKNKFTRKVRRCLQLFGQVIGRETPIVQIRQLHVTRYLRDICKLPVNWARRFDKGESVEQMLAVEMVQKNLAKVTWEQGYKYPLGTFFKSSMRDLGDAGFPNLTVEGIDYSGTRKAEEKKQRALSIAELKVLFEGNVFLAIANDSEQEELYWLSVVAFFTGARPRELCQINPQVDFGQFEGHWYIDISAHSAAGKNVSKTVKTGEERRLPLHRELVELGFHEYLQRMKQKGKDRIFPNSGVKSGNPYQTLGCEFTDLLKGVGLYDDTASPGRQVLGIYVARKTFVTQAAAQKVVSKEMTGHADDRTTEMQRKHYISDPEPLLNKVAELAKFELPLKIPKLAWKV